MSYKSAKEIWKDIITYDLSDNDIKPDELITLTNGLGKDWRDLTEAKVDEIVEVKDKALTYDNFRARATDDLFNLNNKIGFNDYIRCDSFETDIFNHIIETVSNIKSTGKKVLDIGCGCSGLPNRLIKLCEQQSHTLVLCDSPEMLNYLPDSDCICKIPGRFPSEVIDSIIRNESLYDVIICYSVLQYEPYNYIDFVNHCFKLLDKGGQLLIGDFPNESKKERFIINNNLEVGGSKNWTTDNVIFEIMKQAHTNNLDSYLLPPNYNIPFSFIRDDLLIVKPCFSYHIGAIKYELMNKQ